MLKQLGISEPFPFCHGLRRDTFPVNGDSFWVVLAQCQKAPRPGSLLALCKHHPKAVPVYGESVAAQAVTKGERLGDAKLF